MENERIVHEYRRRNADMLRQNEEARRLAESAQKRNTPDVKPVIQPPARPPSSVAMPSETARPPMQPTNMTPRPTPWNPANTSKPVDIRVPLYVSSYRRIFACTDDLLSVQAYVTTVNRIEHHTGARSRKPAIYSITLTTCYHCTHS